ncbi:MAG: GtrA family protein [Marmoricola sp.]|nr:GtrA family protein [Marmoricola sp.]
MWDTCLDLWQTLRRRVSVEVLTFLVVGGLGYVVDVATFNLLLSVSPFSGWDPSAARVVAVAVAMVVTYTGNRWLTWRNAGRHDQRREVALFALFNVVGLGFSVVTLVLSHDVLGLTSRLADNISANVVGLALGTVFRFWSYRRFVFGVPSSADLPVDVGIPAVRSTQGSSRILDHMLLLDERP